MSNLEFGAVAYPYLSVYRHALQSMQLLVHSSIDLQKLCHQSTFLPQEISQYESYGYCFQSECNPSSFGSFIDSFFAAAYVYLMIVLFVQCNNILQEHVQTEVWISICTVSCICSPEFGSSAIFKTSFTWRTRRKYVSMFAWCITQTYALILWLRLEVHFIGALLFMLLGQSDFLERNDVLRTKRLFEDETTFWNETTFGTETTFWGRNDFRRIKSTDQ